MKESNQHIARNFIGRSSSMLRVYDALARIAQSRAPVLVYGETGTGKELAAQSLSGDGPFIAINCAAIPGELLESEIFGHVKGSFTGASFDRAGAATLAHGGVLFLDEVTEMPVALQAKLLRFIQTGEFMPVGATQVQRADIRFVSTTNRDPKQAVAEGKLRQDLYYRLSALSLKLPPLRARGSDIVLLAEHCLLKISDEESRSQKTFTSEALAAMTAYDWPGNVRELEAVIRNVVVMHDGDIIDSHMLGLGTNTFAGVVYKEGIVPFAKLEREAIERAVGLCGGNITEAARQLGLNPSTIHRKRKEWQSGA